MPVLQPEPFPREVLGHTHPSRLNFTLGLLSMVVRTRSDFEQNQRNPMETRWRSLPSFFTANAIRERAIPQEESYALHDPGGHSRDDSVGCAVPRSRHAGGGLGKTSVQSSVTLTAGKKAKTAKASAEKSCGTFMYRKDGKCVDARAKK